MSSAAPPNPEPPNPPTATSRQPSHREDAIAIIHRLRGSGHTAYLAGGCVRDMLLGIEAKDFDVATDAPPDRVRKLFSNTQAVGAKFGVILVRHGKSVIEVATFRTDIDYQDGRRPREVKFTTAEQDAQRRDFTINGLFFDPVANQVIDYVGGQADLQAKLLRAIGEPNHRFEEDHLRLLRAVRFAARFDLKIEEKTAAAIASHAQHLKRISPERIAEELRLMLTPLSRVRAWEMLWRFGITPVVFRTLAERPTESAGLFPLVSPNENISFALALAAAVLCYRIGSGGRIDNLLEKVEVQRSIQACRTTLKISNHESDAMFEILYLSPLLEEQPPAVAKMKRFLARENSRDAIQLFSVLHRYAPDRLPWLLRQFDELLKTDVAPPPLVTGDDLTAQGLQPGKLFKRVLDETYDAQLEERVRDKHQALSFALELAAKT